MSAPAAMPALSNADLGWFFDESHDALVATLGEVPATLVRAEALGDAAVARALGELGLYRHVTAQLPARVDVRALCLIRELLAYVSPLADAIFAVQGLCAHPLAAAGSAEQRRLLDDLATGRAIGAFALTEPDAGSDVGAMRTRARRSGDRFVLDGEKTLISNAGIASHYVVFASADPDAGSRGLAAFLVPAGAPGLTVRPLELAAPHPIGALTFADCQLPADALIGEVGNGFSLAMRTLDTFRVTVGAAAVGMSRRALDEALVHVRARVQFGKPLAEQPVVQSMLADMATELDAARLLTLRAARARDRGDGGNGSGAESAMAKLYATEAAQRIIDSAVQLLGGRGVCVGEMVELLYRAVRPLRIYEGTSEIQRLIIGRGLARGARGGMEGKGP